MLYKRLSDIAEGKFLEKKKVSETKFEEFADKYIELYSKNNKKSWEKDVDRVKPIKKVFKDKLLTKITSFMIEEYKAKRAKEVSPASVNRELALIKHMYTMAIQWSEAESNPVKKVKLFRENNRRLRYLEKEEIEKLLKNSSGYLKNIILVALHTGMRSGEILNLKWQDIDMQRDIVYLLDTKNGDRREIPINSVVKQALKSQTKHKTSSYVFCNKDGSPFYKVRKSFLTALKKSGIIDFRFHDLRHTFASHLVMNGVDLNTVRELMGHKSLRMTLRYAHLSQGHKQKAVNVLAAKWTCPEGEEIYEEESDKKKSFKITWEKV